MTLHLAHFSCFEWFDCKNSQRICGDSLFIKFIIFRSHYNVLCCLRAGRISEIASHFIAKNTMRYRAKDASRTYIVQVPRTNHTNTQKIWFIRIQKHTYDIELFCAIILCFPFWKVLLQPSNFVILISSHILLSSWAFLICDFLYPYVGGWFLGENACWHLIDTETKHMV